jgi:hypothetical protein
MALYITNHILLWLAMGLVYAMKKCFLFTCIIHPAWWVLVHCGLYKSVERASSHEQIPAALENPSTAANWYRLNHVQQLHISSPL